MNNLKRIAALVMVEGSYSKAELFQLAQGVLDLPEEHGVREKGEQGRITHLEESEAKYLLSKPNAYTLVDGYELISRLGAGEWTPSR